MNLNFHYYTVKTLAYFAGFSEKAAQQVAHFSQQVDDYVLGSPFVVHEEPPAFFLDNHLALPFGHGSWVLMPCTTGIDTLRSVSHGYQVHTVMPFHFMMGKPLREVPENADRQAYRCVTAQKGVTGKKEAILIENLLSEAVAKADMEDMEGLMRLGMLLHTYADTYAHGGFSGFHGWENEAVISLALDQATHKQALKESEITFYKIAPSIGHANAGHLPDICAYKISLSMKKTAKDPPEPVIARDNIIWFQKCAKNILDYLCRAIHGPLVLPADWTALKKRIQAVWLATSHSKADELAAVWTAAFPEIPYRYDKRDLMRLELSTESVDGEILKRAGVSREQLLDSYSAEGNTARSCGIVSAKKVDRAFFKYNELAYRHVAAAVGKYASAGTLGLLKEYGRK